MLVHSLISALETLLESGLFLFHLWAFVLASGLSVLIYYPAYGRALPSSYRRLQAKKLCAPCPLIKISSHILNQGLKVNRSLIIKYSDYMWSSIFPSLLTHHCESSQAHSGWELGKFVLIGRLSFVLPSNTKPYNSLSFLKKNWYFVYYSFKNRTLKYHLCWLLSFLTPLPKTFT